MYKDNNPHLPNKKKVVRETNHLTRPPRLEGAEKEAMMQPIKKKKHAESNIATPKKQEKYTEQQRKEYQLRSKKH